MTISDELLAAYVDGELEGAELAHVEQAIAEDHRIAQRVARQRALRERLRGAFDDALHEPVPQRLLQAARLGAAATPAQIIDLAQVRAARARRNGAARKAFPRRVAVAASLVVGLLAGVLIQRFSASGDLTELHEGTLLARGALTRALNEQLASNASGGGAVQVGLSFKAKNGHFCRTFAINAASSLAGLACREQDQWQVLTLTGTQSQNADSQHLRMAASALPPVLLQAVNERISGEPLDAQAESRARSSGWH